MPVDYQQLDFFLTVIMSVRVFWCFVLFCFGLGVVIHYEAGWKFNIMAFK